MNTPCPLLLSLSFPTLVIGNPEFFSRVFLTGLFHSLTVRHHGARDSAVMLALPKGHDSRLNFGERLDSR